MTSTPLQVFFLAAAFQSAAFAAPQTASDCAIAVDSPEQAIARADWVIEGTVDFITQEHPENLIVNQSRAVYQKGTQRVHATNTMVPAPCFAGRTAPFDAKAARKLNGQRIRLYGTRYLVGEKHRYFYVELATKPLPDLSAKKRADEELARLQTGGRTGVQKPIGDGWHRARSGQGHFSVDLPGPYEEITRVSDGVPGFMLRAKDDFGSTFIVVFEPSGLDSGVGGSFDQAMEKPGAAVTSFRGYPALVIAGSPMPATNGALINHSMIFRVPGGTFVIGIATSKDQETKSMQQKERFYRSLSFE